LEGSHLPDALRWEPSVMYARWIEKHPEKRAFFQVCQEPDGTSDYYAYCLEISNRNIPTTLLMFRVRSDAALLPGEMEIFRNICDEIAVAIRASQDRDRLSEMQSAEVAMAERRMVSTYVHDQLGQNLGYLHLKLDQLSNGSGGSARDIRKELDKLREVANDSYEIVRDILKKMQPETIPHLTNFLQEHARTVARRSKFALGFKSIGKPINLPANIQQIIFFTFREILSNIELHASADQVEVLVVWSDDSLDVTVSDNGKGFDAAAIRKDEHFGLDIIQERIAGIMGKVTVHSTSNSGTVVSISIPLGVVREVII
jgi:signal transduction histidine kinase